MSQTFLGTWPAVPTPSPVRPAPAGGAPRRDPWDDTLRWGETFPPCPHPDPAALHLGHATRTIRNKRAVRVGEMPDWEEFRRAASAVKNEAKEPSARAARCALSQRRYGGIVHWARDAAEANRS